MSFSRKKGYVPSAISWIPTNGPGRCYSPIIPMIIWGFPQIRAIHSLRFRLPIIRVVRIRWILAWAHDCVIRKFRVPTLRNIALTAPYGHNGYFKTLEEIVHFYNVRDVEDFPPAEYPETVNKDELGNLGLSQEEETAIVAFLRTLTDCIK